MQYALVPQWCAATLLASMAMPDHQCMRTDACRCPLQLWDSEHVPINSTQLMPYASPHEQLHILVRVT